MTQYHPEERYPGGDFPNQDPRPVCGLPLYAQQDRCVWLVGAEREMCVCVCVCLC